MIKLKRIKSENGCKDCLGGKTNESCRSISKEAENQGISSCTGMFIYVEDDKNDKNS